MNNQHGGTGDEDGVDGEIVDQAGRIVRGSLHSWPRTARLCAIIATVGVTATGSLALKHSLDEPPQRECVVVLQSPPPAV